MLQKVEFEGDFQEERLDRGYLFQPAFYWTLFKRRWAVFFIPFVLTGSVAIGAVMVWPPTYFSEGKILVEAQQIPTELVRPTVTTTAQERIQAIEQRTMTRDILVAIADKFKLFPEKRPLMTVSELVDLMKKNTKIEPVDQTLEFKQRSRTESNLVIFSVGFEYGDPDIAASVANELVTRILSEDLRDRTSRASETTKFLQRDVQKLQADNAALDAKISQLRLTQGLPASSLSAAENNKPSLLTQLKDELVQRSALYSDRHPLVQTLKRQIEALEKSAAKSPEATANPADSGAVANSNNVAASLDALTSQQEALQKNLETATAKLNAARLGESLEKDQQSEKLDVIEQPTAPQTPIKPKRLKLSLLGLVAAFMAGAGSTFIAEISDKGIRRSSDIFGIVDSQLVVSIPYISTAEELRRQRRRTRILVFGTVLFLVSAGAAIYLLLPGFDLMLVKARVGLFR